MSFGRAPTLPELKRMRRKQTTQIRRRLSVKKTRTRRKMCSKPTNRGPAARQRFRMARLGYLDGLPRLVVMVVDWLDGYPAAEMQKDGSHTHETELRCRKREMIGDEAAEDRVKEALNRERSSRSFN